MVTAILGVAFALAAVNAISSSRAALEYREMRTASTQLELSAHTLSMIELIADPPASIEQERIDAVELLEDPTVFDTTGLDAPTRARVVELTNELTANAATTSLTNRADVGELLETLHADAGRTNDAAIDAERSAFVSLLISAITGIAIVVLAVLGLRQQAQLKRSLRSQAKTDFLTGLPNRRELAVCLDAASEDMANSANCTAMFYMDLDGFKEINETGGHASGDDVLREVSATLLAAQQPGETLMRLGGDEFGVIAIGLESDEAALATAERYRDALKVESSRGDAIHISIGVAVTGQTSELEDLQGRSNLAMYVAKEQQGSSVTLYQDEFREAALKESTVLRALRTSDLDAEFYLEYQPVVSINNDDVFFVEALLRWNSPTLGRVRPDEFIPLAEQSGEIIRIGQWVLRQAFQQLSQWQSNPLTRELAISCNVSIHELADDRFLDALLDVETNTGDIDRSKLIIEVTESAASGPLVQKRLAEISDLGYRVAIDDFGSGFSNFAQLIHTPFDILKLDRELMLSLEAFDEDGSRSREVLSAVTAIARSQAAPVVCEGVEESTQLEPLLDAGISHIQGWLISKSVSPEDLLIFLDERNGLAPPDQLPNAA